MFLAVAEYLLLAVSKFAISFFSTVYASSASLVSISLLKNSVLAVLENLKYKATFSLNLLRL